MMTKTTTTQQTRETPRQRVDQMSEDEKDELLEQVADDTDDEVIEQICRLAIGRYSSEETTS